MNFFSYESRFSQVFLKLTWSCWLNMLWFICSLPVFTAGASTAALYTVTLKIADGKEETLTKEFFRAFRANFKQATRIWLLMLVIGILLALVLLIPVNALIHALAGANEISAVMPPLGALVLIGISVLLTLIGGLIPSRKASRMDPVAALRSE